ncbi:10107_t:CDS:2, partial [Paraglomus brasilianum]
MTTIEQQLEVVTNAYKDVKVKLDRLEELRSGTAQPRWNELLEEKLKRASTERDLEVAKRRKVVETLAMTSTFPTCGIPMKQNTYQPL